MKCTVNDYRNENIRALKDYTTKRKKRSSCFFLFRPSVRPSLLLEVSPLLLVDEHEVQVVLDAELLVDVAHGGREVVAGQEHADGDGLAAHGRAVHDLILGDRLVVVEGVRAGAWRGTGARGAEGCRKSTYTMQL